MRLLKLINDLLDLIRLEAGRMDIKRDPLEVAGFIKGLASAVRQVFENKHVKLETHADPQLGVMVADREKIEKIILNLLFNAIKFTPAGGRVWLRAEKQGGDFALIVSDTGVGIAEKNLPFVFDRFWQADSSSKRKFARRGHRPGAGEGTGRNAKRHGHGGQRGGQRRDVHRAAAVSKSRRHRRRTRQNRHAPRRRRRRGGLGGMAGEFVSPRGTVPGRGGRRAATTASRRNSAARHRPVVLVAEDEPDMRRFLEIAIGGRLRRASGRGRRGGAGKGAAVPAGHHSARHDDAGDRRLEVCRELRKRAPRWHSRHFADGPRRRGDQI